MRAGYVCCKNCGWKTENKDQHCYIYQKEPAKYCVGYKVRKLTCQK